MNPGEGEGSWHLHGESQNYPVHVYRGIFLCPFGLSFEFSLAEGDSTLTLSGRSLFSFSCFDFSSAMLLARPTCRSRSVQEFLSFFWLSVISSCILALPREHWAVLAHLTCLLNLYKEITDG